MKISLTGKKFLRELRVEIAGNKGFKEFTRYFDAKISQ